MNREQRIVELLRHVWPDELRTSEVAQRLELGYTAAYTTLTTLYVRNRVERIPFHRHMYWRASE